VCVCGVAALEWAAQKRGRKKEKGSKWNNIELSSIQKRKCC